jgi:hypothetical protein
MIRNENSEMIFWTEQFTNPDKKKSQSPKICYNLWCGK